MLPSMLHDCQNAFRSGGHSIWGDIVVRARRFGDRGDLAPGGAQAPPAFFNPHLSRQMFGLHAPRWCPISIIGKMSVGARQKMVLVMTSL